MAMKTCIRLILAAIVAGASANGQEPPKIQPIPVEQAAAKIQAGAQVLDVRTKEEWDEGHLKDAKHVPLTMEGYADKAKAVLDSNRPVVVYCHSGNRSAAAVTRLRAGGFTAVFDMAGGITDWKKEGKPVVK